MIVDTPVRGDSRVQKAAYSAAEAGWEVTLLGRSPDRDRHEFDLGGARVELLPVANTLARRRRAYRRSPLRQPLAYPPTGIANLRQQQMLAWRADHRQRCAQLTVALTEGPVRWARSRRWALDVELLLIRAVHRWVSIRSRQTRRLAQRHIAADTLADRVGARFWPAVRGTRSWRRIEPQLWEYELAFGERLDRLRPDIIHANDFRMLGVGARAALRARAGGRTVKLVWDAHEYLPGMRPWQNRPHWLAANCAHEREYAPYADAVVTVSEEIAALLQRRHGLASRPTVVRNAPELRSLAPAGEPPGDVRAACGLDAGTPLLVYSGVAAEQRGLDLMVDALPDLPGVHVALVVTLPEHPLLRRLRQRAERAGAGDRLHVLPIVAHWDVVRFLATADIGVSPIQRWPNYDMALSTKFYEYSQARLPIVSSDVRTAAQTIRATGQGEVFAAGDREAYVRAVRAVLADPARYRAAYERPGLLDDWTWQAQARVLDQVYTRLLPATTTVGAPRARSVTASVN
ncbi:glycosyltransferase family 4 protein [Luedemannella helvata]